MATGPDHYSKALDLLEAANDCSQYDEAAGIIAQAQVHATLALAAATALASLTVDDAGMPPVDVAEWIEVASGDLNYVRTVRSIVRHAEESPSAQTDHGGSR